MSLLYSRSRLVFAATISSELAMLSDLAFASPRTEPAPCIRWRSAMSLLPGRLPALTPPPLIATPTAPSAASTVAPAARLKGNGRLDRVLAKAVMP